MIPYVAEAAVDFARERGRKVSDAFSNGMTAAVNGIGAAYGFVAEKATDMVHGVGVAAGNARYFVDERVSAVGKTIGNVHDAVTERVDAARSSVRAGIDTVRAVPGMAAAGLASLGHSAIAGIQGWWKDTMAVFRRGYEAGYGGRESATERERQAAVDEADRDHEHVMTKEPASSEPFTIETMRDAYTPKKPDTVISVAYTPNLDDIKAKYDGRYPDPISLNPLRDVLRPSFVPGFSAKPDKAISVGLGDMREVCGKSSVGVGKEPIPTDDGPSFDDGSLVMA